MIQSRRVDGCRGGVIRWEAKYPDKVVIVKRGDKIVVHVGMAALVRGLGALVREGRDQMGV